MDCIKPNFFILGAPKCGTSSFYEYFNVHSRVFMCPGKEPGYFCTDLEIGTVKTEDQYLRLFAHANSAHKIIGEATPMYLYSQKAVPNILEFTSDLHFLVLLRDPVEMLQSYHAQLLFTGQEIESNLEKIWENQDNRMIPATCREPKYLRYGEVCRLGEQVSRLLKHVQRESVFFIVLEDFAENPDLIWRELLDFLKLSWEPVTYTIANRRKETRLRVTKGLLDSIGRIKRGLGIYSHTGLIAPLHRMNTRLLDPEIKITDSFREKLRRYFRKDIHLLSSLLKYDFERRWWTP